MSAHHTQQVDAQGERTLELPSGVSTHIIDEGSGPTVLLLHGNPDNADEWKSLIALLKSDFRCLAPDLPGYGRQHRSSALPASYRYTREEQIAFVDDVLAQYQLHGKMVLVVHDIGGIMGVPWAARNTNRLHAVIYTNTVAYPGFQWFALARRWGNDSPVGRPIARLSMAALQWFDGWLFRRVFARQNPQLTAAELERFVQDFAFNAIAKSTSLCEFRSLTRPDFFDGYDQLLKSIAAAVPTLTLWGQSDPYVPERFAQQLFAQQTILLPDVGHWVPIRAADTIAQHIRALHALSDARG